MEKRILTLYGACSDLVVGQPAAIYREDGTSLVLPPLTLVHPDPEPGVKIFETEAAVYIVHEPKPEIREVRAFKISWERIERELNAFPAEGLGAIPNTLQTRVWRSPYDPSIWYGEYRDWPMNLLDAVCIRLGFRAGLDNPVQTRIAITKKILEKRLGIQWKHEVVLKDGVILVDVSAAH